MSELLDVFDDEGLLDLETRKFLVEALSNSERQEWHDILEPFVSVEPVLAVLDTVPGVLTRSINAITLPSDDAGPAAPSARALAFLDSLPKVIVFSGLHMAARCSKLCRSARVVVSEPAFWLCRTETMCSLWNLSLPTDQDGTWKEKFFKVLRPRFDGIYVGECSFKRWVPTGHHTDLRKNAASLAADGGRGGSYEWVRYRRYVRLIPPHWALVLQDACPRTVAEPVIIESVDFETHENPRKPEGAMSDANTQMSDAGTLRKRICLGRFTFTVLTSSIEIKYTADDADFLLVFNLSHQGPNCFADRLEWSLYTRTNSATGEVLEFSLGKLPDWKGGGLVDEGKDHFPSMDLRPSILLEHLLQ